MDQKQIKETFKQSNVFITGSHFVYQKKADGWYHGTDYFNKAAIYVYPRRLAPLCKEIVDRFGRTFEVVVGPTVGGVSLIQWAAFYAAPYTGKKEIKAVFVDEEDILELHQAKAESLSPLAKMFQFHANGMVKVKANSKKEIIFSYECKVGTRRVLKRGYENIVEGKKCLVLDDALLTGFTVSKTIQAIHRAGGKVIGVGALCNESGGKVTAATLGVPRLESLLNLEIEVHKERDCPLCEKFGVQSVRTDIGHGKEFLFRIGKPMK